MPEAPGEESSKKSQTTRSTESEVQRATTEQSRVAEVTKTETSKINHEVVNVTAKLYRGQNVTISEQSAVESHTTAFHTDSHQAAGLENNPRSRTNSGKQDGRYFNKRGGTMLRTHRSDSRTGGERAARTVV